MTFQAWKMVFLNSMTSHNDFPHSLPSRKSPAYINPKGKPACISWGIFSITTTNSRGLNTLNYTDYPFDAAST